MRKKLPRRYKKKLPPIDESFGMNGPVIVTRQADPYIPPEVKRILLEE